MEPRDVSAILANIEHKENERVTEIDEYIEQEDLEIKNSRVRTSLTYLRKKDLIENIGSDTKSVWIAK